LSKIFDNYPQPHQCAEHNPAGEQQHCGASGQPTKKTHLSIPSPKLRFARQLDDSHPQDVSKYLEGANSSQYKDKSSSRNFEKVHRRLTLQLFTS
jgi:hypothetical protein